MQPITAQHIHEFMHYHDKILGRHNFYVERKLVQLLELGFLPLRIRAVPEGTIVNNPNMLMTVENTVPGFHWVVGFFESLLLKIWNTCSVATYSHILKGMMFHGQLFTGFNGNLDYQVHDFGYRGCSSEETAALSGAAHLINFKGTDTVPALRLIDEFYAPTSEQIVIGSSVPATEHSVMCSFGMENEIKAFEHMLNKYPTGIISIVSDTYDLWNVIDTILPALKEKILERNGKVVIRPDSGDPYQIICGDENERGLMVRLAELFGYTINSKGFKELNPKIGMIYGDGMYKDKIQQILEGMHAKGFATNNLVFGIGGLLLQQHNRDDLGMTSKASWLMRENGETMDLRKTPKTDAAKISLGGKLKLVIKNDIIPYFYETTNINSPSECVMQNVFNDGTLLVDEPFYLIRERANIWE